LIRRRNICVTGKSRHQTYGSSGSPVYKDHRALGIYAAFDGCDDYYEGINTVESVLAMRVLRKMSSLAPYKHRWAAIVGLLLAAAVGGYFGIRASEGGSMGPCTAIGCTSGIFVNARDVRHRVPRDSSFSVCVDGKCKALDSLGAHCRLCDGSDSR
jgi:hypothetical protein